MTETPRIDHSVSIMSALACLAHVLSLANNATFPALIPVFRKPESDQPEWLDQRHLLRRLSLSV